MAARAIRSIVWAVAIGLFATTVESAEYPARPIRVVITFSAGGSADILGRTVAQKLNEAWGQPVIADNRPGAAGNLGATIVARAPPDGHTLMILTTAHCISQTLYPELEYKLERDFAPVTVLTTSPLLLVIYPGIPVKTVPQFVDWAKKNRLVYASGGNGTLSHLSLEMFKLAAKFDATHVAYKGSPPALPDLITGRAHVMAQAIPEVYPLAKVGKLRPIGLMASKRHAMIPDVATFPEQGYPDFVITNWAGVAAPAGTPVEVLNKLAREITRIVHSPDVSKRLGEQGFDPLGGTPVEFSKLIRSETERFGKAVKDSGAKVD